MTKFDLLLTTFETIIKDIKVLSKLNWKVCDPAAMLCYAMLCYAMICYAMLCCAVLCYAMS